MVLPNRIFKAARDGDRDTVIAYLNAPAEAGGLPDVNEQSYELCQRAVRRDHSVGPLWPITWTSPPRCEPFPTLIASNNKGQVLPVEVLCPEKHGCEIDALDP